MLSYLHYHSHSPFGSSHFCLALHSPLFFFLSLCHFPPRIMVISPDTHPLVIHPPLHCSRCILYARVKLVDVICLTHAWIERCEPNKG